MLFRSDEGVLYREAEVKCQLSDIVAESNPTEMKKFLPCDNDGTHHLPYAVQVNHFTCGGIAIGACISHKIADGSSFINFMKDWAATARCETARVMLYIHNFNHPLYAHLQLIYLDLTKHML